MTYHSFFHFCAFHFTGTFAKQCDFRVDVSPATYMEGGCFTIEGSPTEAAEIQDDYKSWADAETACQAKGGYLARFSIPEWQAFEAYEEGIYLIYVLQTFLVIITSNATFLRAKTGDHYTETPK